MLSVRITHDKKRIVYNLLEFFFNCTKEECIKYQQNECSVFVYPMDCVWRWWTMRWVSVCSPDVVSALAADKQDVESGRGLFPLNSAWLCYVSAQSCVHRSAEEKGVLNCKRRPGSSWGRRGKLMTKLPLCQTGVTCREESVFTNDMICKWSGSGEALRTRWSPRRGRSVCSSGIRWIKIITSVLCRALLLSLSLLLLSFRAAPVWYDPFCFPICIFFPPLFSTISPYILPLLLPPLLLPFLHFLCSCLKLRTEQLVIEDHCLSSGPQDLQCLSPQLIFARQFFGPLFVCFFSPLPSSSPINSTSPFWNWIFIWDGPGAPVVFMPPSSHQFSFLFSSLHFRPFSPLSPPVNYLLSVQLGQELHFPPDGGLKKKKEGLSAVGCGWLCEFVGKRRNWEDPDQSDCVPDSLLRKVQDVLTSLELLQTDKKLFLCYVTDMF